MSTPAPGPWRLVSDLLWTRALLVLTQAERRGELHPDIHRFLADRYAKLAAACRARGRRALSSRFHGKAIDHARRAGDDDLPPACAMGLPRPRPRAPADARAGTVLRGPWRGSGDLRSLPPPR